MTASAPGVRAVLAAFLILAPFIQRQVRQVHSQSPPEPLQTFLRKHVAFAEAELSALERGQPITKSLAVGDKREFASIGIVRIRAARERFLEQYRDIVAFKKSEMVRQIGKFSNPPRLDDLRPLTLDAQDIRDLQKCKVGDCKLRLPAAGIQRFQREVNWRSAGADAQANAIMRELLRDHTRGYLAGGHAALGQYDDRRPALRLADELKLLLGESPYLIEYVPEFHAYLLEFPYATLPNSEDFVYWEKGSFGLKPVVSVTHVTIHTPALNGPGMTLIAAKQLYASHYFDASLALTVLIDAPSADPAPTFYIVYLNRSLVTRLGGMFGGMIRSRLQNRVRDAMARSLRLMKDRLEEDPVRNWSAATRRLPVAEKKGARLATAPLSRARDSRRRSRSPADAGSCQYAAISRRRAFFPSVFGMGTVTSRIPSLKTALAFSKIAPLGSGMER